ncbi:MAG: hypothetical protein UY72_C0007G0020 [Candidatus Uhrbacteria bacterium GW2011_GWD2_52_7]|uniref:Uncharacterized protein n=1 Tax=Candidatus Uhrbacteria bacterium GW2011_GWD2_52_7 TaxID=1618989 RepID=A0A0G1XHC4_9BACT|nr:MAG: hypothetical protein UY72_C0007G0020 [Candidatus Uhrbacteria bacterium GW2011_GWD2_52_7]
MLRVRAESVHADTDRLATTDPQVVTQHEGGECGFGEHVDLVAFAELVDRDAEPAVLPREFPSIARERRAGVLNQPRHRFADDRAD